jgi:hypothetical protein
MSYYLPPPAYEGEPSVESLTAAECARADRRITYLDEIADLAMELARAQQRKALEQLEASPEDTPEGAPRERDAAAGFLNAARAVRVTLALQAKLQAGVNARRIELVFEQKLRGEARQKDRELNALARQGDAEEACAKVIRREARDRGDVEQLVEDAGEAVDRNWSDRDYIDRPIGAIVAEVCETLGVAVDWSRWEGEDWAIEEAETCAEGSPFAKARADEAAPAVNCAGAYEVSGPGAQATGPP